MHNYFLLNTTESPQRPDNVDSEAERPAAKQHERFWTRSTANKNTTARMTTVLDAVLKQNQGQADKDQTTMQSIATTLGKAVQCFERCANAAERHARP